MVEYSSKILANEVKATTAITEQADSSGNPSYPYTVYWRCMQTNLVYISDRNFNFTHQNLQCFADLVQPVFTQHVRVFVDRQP